MAEMTGATLCRPIHITHDRQTGFTGNDGLEERGAVQTKHTRCVDELIVVALPRLEGVGLVTPAWIHDNERMVIVIERCGVRGMRPHHHHWRGVTELAHQCIGNTRDEWRLVVPNRSRT